MDIFGVGVKISSKRCGRSDTSKRSANIANIKHLFRIDLGDQSKHEDLATAVVYTSTRYTELSLWQIALLKRMKSGFAANMLDISRKPTPVCTPSYTLSNEPHPII